MADTGLQNFPQKGDGGEIRAAARGRRNEIIHSRATAASAVRLLGCQGREESFMREERRMKEASEAASLTGMRTRRGNLIS